MLFHDIVVLRFDMLILPNVAIFNHVLYFGIIALISLFHSFGMYFIHGEWTTWWIINWM